MRALKELEQIKSSIEGAKEDMAMEEGKYNLLLQQVKKEHGVTVSKQRKKAIEKHKEKMADKNEELQEKFTRLEENYDWR